MSFIVRSANVVDMEAIYLMGFDQWGAGQSTEDYLSGCHSSVKYQLGDWYCLQSDGGLMSSLIVYSNQFGLTKGYRGIGSVATHADFRRKGYAETLIKTCIARIANENCQGVFLFSDIQAEYYERFGFAFVTSVDESALMFLALMAVLYPRCPGTSNGRSGQSSFSSVLILL